MASALRNMLSLGNNTKASFCLYSSLLATFSFPTCPFSPFSSLFFSSLLLVYCSYSPLYHSSTETLRNNGRAWMQKIIPVMLCDIILWDLPVLEESIFAKVIMMVMHSVLHVKKLFFFKGLFILRVRERRRKRVWRFTLQMAVMVKVGPGPSQEPVGLSRSPMQVAGAQTWEPFFYCFSQAKIYELHHKWSNWDMNQCWCGIFL